MEARKEEASPVELSALLMDAVCTPAEREQTALGELAGHLGMEVNILQSELMFLRAFAAKHIGNGMVDVAMLFLMACAFLLRLPSEALHGAAHCHWRRWVKTWAAGSHTLRERISIASF